MSEQDNTSRCNHKEASRIKPGPSTVHVFACKVCKKLIKIGKPPKKKNGCFGKRKHIPYYGSLQPVHEGRKV